jgi:hypothetical protein
MTSIDLEQVMMDFYLQRVAAGSTTPVADTEREFETKVPKRVRTREYDRKRRADPAKRKRDAAVRRRWRADWRRKIVPVERAPL